MLSKIQGGLAGYKTYIASIATIIGVIAAIAKGEAALNADTIQIIVTAILAGFLRAGISKSK